jgi:hypothetical protein
MSLVLVLNGARWIGGFPTGRLTEGIEQGAAHAETQAKSEVGDEVIRKAIRTHRDTLPFWSALAVIDDFLIEPVLLGFRAVLVATLFTGAAALMGRSLQYDRALVQCAYARVFWVLGLAVRLVLLIVLRRGEDDVETSLALFLPPGSYPAPIWLALRQLDLFALLGWTTMARGGWKRGDAPLVAAVVICASLGLLELGVRVLAGLLLGASIRLSLITR